MAAKELVGKVTHYFGKIGVVTISLSKALRVGDSIEIGEGETKLVQRVDSMQLNHVNIDSSEAGSEIGLKVSGKVREGAEVYRVEA